MEEHVCDGSVTVSNGCRDGADEEPAMCAQWNCTAGYWKCKDGRKCVIETSLCDKEANCNDGSDQDPAFCGELICPKDKWKCKNGLQCIQNQDVCDGKNDCIDKSEEDPSMCILWSCPYGIKCADNLQCIYKNKTCNGGDIDCHDKSDELCQDSCLKVALPRGEKSIIRRCSEDASICVPVDLYCDGVPHCPDHTDERLSGCTCEDGGLISCQRDGHAEKICLSKKWISTGTLNLSVSTCEEFLNNINTPIISTGNKSGMYISWKFSNVLDFLVSKCQDLLYDEHTSMIPMGIKRVLLAVAQRSSHYQFGPPSVWSSISLILHQFRPPISSILPSV